MDDALTRTGGAAWTTVGTRLPTPRRLRPHAHSLPPRLDRRPRPTAKYTGEVYNGSMPCASPRSGLSRLIPRLEMTPCPPAPAEALRGKIVSPPARLWTCGRCAGAHRRRGMDNRGYTVAHTAPPSPTCPQPATTGRRMTKTNSQIHWRDLQRIDALRVAEVRPLQAHTSFGNDCPAPVLGFRAVGLHTPSVSARRGANFPRAASRAF